MRFAGYTLGEELHRGHRCRICRATRTRDGSPVVMKILAGRRADPGQAEALRREFEFMRMVVSEHVVAVHELIASGRRHALVMEDFGGTSLDRLASGRPLPVPDVTALGRLLVAGLRDIHARGILHRDIKPANILVNQRTRQLKITDFAVATRCGEPTRQLNLRELGGTLAYMAPEQTGWIESPEDVRVDYYALGGTLYELLTGRPPFRAPALHELLRLVLHETPPEPAGLNKQVPPRVSLLVMRLLAKQPAARPADLAEIEAGLSDEPPPHGVTC